jgi:hypothetical protein
MGRPKGAKNKRSFNAEELFREHDFDPLEFLILVAAGDWKALGFKAATKTTFTAQGIEIEEDTVPLKERTAAAKEASKYLYAQKQSVALSSGETGFKIIVEDYLAKPDKKE